MFKYSTIGEILESKAIRNGTKPFIYFKDKTVSYEQVNEKANRVANWFLSVGFKKGDRVAILVNNCLEWLYVWLGLAKIGVVSVPLNTHHKGSILQYQINHCDSQLMVISKNLIDRIRSIRGNLAALTTLVVYPSNKGCSELDLDTISFPELLRGSPANPESDVKYYDDLMILYTTDSRGPSQGVVSPHKQYVRCGEKRAKLARMTQDDVWYCMTPLYHVIPLGDVLMTCLIADAAMVIVDRFSVSKFWWDIRRYKATVAAAFGALMKRLYMQSPRDDDTTHSLRLFIVPDAPKSIHEAFERRFNLPVTDAYGMTEVDPVIACAVEERKIGSCGKAAEDLEVRIFDDNDNQLKPGEIGEIVCRPKEPYIMMKGYYKMPDKTLERWSNSWFHTDDSGYQDEEGYFYFVEAKNDGIKWRGENVSPFELEEIVNSHPDVLESIVVKIPSELGGSDAKVIIQLRGGKNVTPEQIVEFCEQRMAFFMVPRYIEFVDRFPKSEMGEVLKSDLRTITSKIWDREKVGYKIKRD